MGIVVGLLAGYATLGLRLGIAATERFFFGTTEENLASVAATLPWYALFFVPVMTGILIAVLLWLGQRTGLAPGARAGGVADLLEARAIRGGRIELKSGLYSSLLAILSLGGGASAGREGPAVHLGGTLASWLSGGVGLGPRGSRTLLACGAAAAVSASFNAPVAGALFAFEVVLGHYALRTIAPVAVASVIGALIVRIHLGPDPVFGVLETFSASLWDYPAAALLGIAAAGLAILFDRGTLNSVQTVESHAQRWKIPLWSLPVPGGILIGALALIAPEILGVGYEATSNALATHYVFGELVLLIVLKTIATQITLAFRFAGGVFSPSMYLGAMLGSAFGLMMMVILGDQTAGAGFFAVIGMGAVAGAVLGAPLSTTLIVFELTSSYEAAVAVLVAVSLATALTQSALGGSLFQKQLQSRGYDISGGSSRLVLQTIRVRDVMMPLGDWAGAQIDDGVCVYEDDTLGRTLGVFDAEDLDGAAVRSRQGDQAIVGWITKADAHAAYAKALADISEEEHQ
ncbi:MAG: chloride channel protein [Alphaproteobacteria bacterium]|nr:chloride channel protein [Alphaproteobacteria bacterium]